jgi:hypothetical protein
MDNAEVCAGFMPVRERSPVGRIRGHVSATIRIIEILVRVE